MCLRSLCWWCEKMEWGQRLNWVVRNERVSGALGNKRIKRKRKQRIGIVFHMHNTNN